MSSPKWLEAFGPSCSGRVYGFVLFVSLALSRAYIGGRGGSSFLIKIMYEYDCKLIRFHAVWSSILGFNVLVG